MCAGLHEIGMDGSRLNRESRPSEFGNCLHRLAIAAATCFTKTNVFRTTSM